MAKEKFNLKEALKNNPEFTKQLMEAQRAAEAESSTAKIFDDFYNASSSFGFKPIISVNDELERIEASNSAEEKFKANSPYLGTGRITDKRENGISVFEYLTGKIEVSISLAEAVSNSIFSLENQKSRYAFKIKNAEKSVVKADLYSENNDFYAKLIKLYVVKVEKGNKENLKASTYADFSPFNFYETYDENGVKYLSSVLYSTEDKNKEPLAVIKLTLSSKPSIEVYTVKDLTSSHEDYYVVPIIVDENEWKAKYDLCNDSFNRCVKEGFINKLSYCKEEEGEKALKAWLSNEIENNPSFSKSSAVFAYDNNKLPEKGVKNSWDSRVKEVDELSLTNYLYPKFGEETVDPSKYELTEFGYPVITVKDVTNLSILKIEKSYTEEILSTSETSIKGAKLIKENAEKEIGEHTNERLKLAGNLLKALKTNDFEAIKNSLIDDDVIHGLLHYKDIENNLEASNTHVKFIIKQITEFKKLSERIEHKIKIGEFSNLYMQSALVNLNNLFKKKEIIKDGKDNGVFSNYIALINDIYNKDEEYKTRLQEISCNTIFSDSSKDSFGNKSRSLYSIFKNESSTLTKIIPDEIKDDAEATNKYLMEAMFSNFNFISNLAKVPYKFILSLMPRFLLSSTNESSEDKLNKLIDRKEKAIKKGFDFGIFIELANSEAKFVEIMSLIRKHIEDNYDTVMHKIKVAYSEAKKLISNLENKKFRRNIDKAEAFSQYAVVINNVEYFEIITSGKNTFDGDIKTTDPKNIEITNVANIENHISVEEYLELSDEDKKNFAITRNMDKNEIIDYIIDYLINLVSISQFMTVYGKISFDYIALAEKNTNSYGNRSDKDFSKLFSSSMSLFVPCISALEYEVIPEDIKDEDKDNELDFSQVIPNDTKVSIGSNAVDDVITPIGTANKLLDARSVYLTNCVKYVELTLNTVKAILNI